MTKEKPTADAPKLRTLIVRNNKGGVGKTTLAILLRAAALAADRGEPALIDADRTSKLSLFFPGVTQLGAGLTMAEAADKPEVAESYFDPAYHLMKSKDCIIDLGANVPTQFYAWYNDSGVEKMLAKTVTIKTIIPITADPSAFDAGLEAVQATLTGKHSTPPMIVLNQADGRFSSYESDERYLTLKKLQSEGRIEIVDLTKCTASGWVKLEKLRIEPLRAANMSQEEIQKVAGLTDLEAHRTLTLIPRWLAENVENLASAWQ